MNIYLVRHTSVDVPRGICYGQTDVPLKESFPQEADSVKKKLETIFNDFTPDKVFTSPLSRCTRLAFHCGYADAIHDSRILEMNFGEWEMKDFNKIQDPQLQVWYDDYLNVRVTGGESFNDQFARVVSFFEELKSHKHENVLIFTHGGVLACAKIYSGLITPADAFATLEGYGTVLKILI